MPQLEVVRTVYGVGWRYTTNLALLKRALEIRFDALPLHG